MVPRGETGFPVPPPESGRTGRHADARALVVFANGTISGTYWGTALSVVGQPPAVGITVVALPIFTGTALIGIVTGQRRRRRAPLVSSQRG